MIKVLVVDDHELIRQGFARMLTDEPGIEVLGEAESGEEAMDMLRHQNPDVILMDLKMPGIGGMEATRRITRQNPEIKVIAVTAVTDDPYLSRVFESGALGYVSKASHITEMIKAIKKVSLGQRYISPDVAQAMALKTAETSPFDTLSEREMQIAMMIVDCQKVQDISDKLCVSPKTVNTYRYRLFEKLNIASDVELTLLAARNGLLDLNAPE